MATPWMPRQCDLTYFAAAGPVGQAMGYNEFVGPLKSVTLVNADELTLVFSQPFRPILTDLANDSLGVVDPAALAKKGATKFCEYPIGSGPYEVKSFGPGGNPVVLVPNPFHKWGSGTSQNQGPGYLSSVTLSPVTSDATAASELLSGGLQLSQLAGDELPRISGNPALKVYTVKSHQLYQLSFNIAKPPFNQVAVRRAFAEAVNRNAIIKAVLDGLGVPAYSPVPEDNPYYDSKSVGYAPQYNPAAARRTLSADHITGPFTFLTFNTPDDIAAGQLIQAELAQVGVKTNIVSEPIANFIALAVKGQYGISLNWFSSVDPDVMYITLHSSTEGGGGANWSGYSSKTLDTLLDQGRATLSATQAAMLYGEAQRFVDTNVIIDPLWLSETPFVAASNLRGFHTDDFGLYPIAGDLWLAKS